jgi:serralysin
MQLRRGTISALVMALACLFSAAQAQASFHLWTINEVYTNSDGTVQFIEMINGATSGENFVSFTSIASDLNNFDFPTDLVGNTANKTFLIATPGFAALPGGVTPDYTVPVNFFSVAGDSIDYGGGLDTFTFSGAQLPHDGILSLKRNLTTGTNSPKNFAGQQGSISLPEPATLMLAALAGSLLLMYRARRHR